MSRSYKRERQFKRTMREALKREHPTWLDKYEWQD